MKSNFVSTSTRKRYWWDLLVVMFGVLGLLEGVLKAHAASPTTTSLLLSSSSVTSGTAVTFTATVTNPSPVTVGTVTFCAVATYFKTSAVIGTAQLTTTGTAVITIRPGIGSHSYYAIFQRNYLERIEFLVGVAATADGNWHVSDDDDDHFVRFGR